MIPAVIVAVSVSAVQSSHLEGLVMKCGRGEVSIKLESAANLSEGDRIELSTMAGVLEMMVGTYEVSSMGGGNIVAHVIHSNMPPSDGMKVKIWVMKALPIEGEASDSSAIEGEVVEVSGTDVKIKLVSLARLPRTGDSVSLLYITSTGMEIEVGTWKVTGKEGDLIKAAVVESATSPRKGLKAFITPDRQVEKKKTGISFPEKGSMKSKKPQGEQVRSLFSPDYGKKKPIDVKGIQQALKTLGYDPGPADGIMGEKTRLAIVRYQRDKGFPTNGRPSHDLHERLHIDTLGYDHYIKSTAEKNYKQGADYFYGNNGKPKDYVKAASFFRKSAENGHPGSQNHLGAIYGKGLGVQKDYKEAVKWYQSAADNGLANGYYNLGVMYANGNGVQKDQVEAVRLFQIAAEQGDALAQHNLAVMLKMGWGVARDHSGAAMWFRKAADQNLAASQHALGLMYEEGAGVQKDIAVAVQLYRKAAAQGYAPAQKKLKDHGLND